MIESLSHLPEIKQHEIAEILEIIKDVANPEVVILFGSHTSDKWVEDEYIEKGATYSYMSDYDILVVIGEGDKEKEHEIASKIENRTQQYKNDVSPIVHTINYINKGLEDGQYFFRDIVDEGIILYNSGNISFANMQPLTADKRRERAEYYYTEWIQSGIRFLDHTKVIFNNAIEKDFKLNEVIFNLNQTAEKFYGGILLVFTGYKPKTHRLKIYRKYSKAISEELNHVFRYPIDNPEEYRLFDIFNKSYLDSRYKDDYFISKEDLASLIFKVEKIEQIAIKICTERINSID